MKKQKKTNKKGGGPAATATAPAPSAAAPEETAAPKADAPAPDASKEAPQQSSPPEPAAAATAPAVTEAVVEVVPSVEAAEPAKPPVGDAGVEVGQDGTATVNSDAAPLEPGDENDYRNVDPDDALDSPASPKDQGSIIDRLGLKKGQLDEYIELWKEVSGGR